MRRIRLTESQLNRVIRNSVRHLIRESEGTNFCDFVRNYDEEQNEEDIDSMYGFDNSYFESDEPNQYDEEPEIDDLEQPYDDEYDEYDEYDDYDA